MGNDFLRRMKEEDSASFDMGAKGRAVHIIADAIQRMRNEGLGSIDIAKRDQAAYCYRVHVLHGGDIRILRPPSRGRHERRGLQRYHQASWASERLGKPRP